MTFDESVTAVTDLLKHKALRTKTDRDELVPEWMNDFEPVAEWADELNEKVLEVKELMAELAECDRVDIRDFHANLDNALQELLELVGRRP